MPTELNNLNKTHQEKALSNKNHKYNKVFVKDIAHATIKLILVQINSNCKVLQLLEKNKFFLFNEIFKKKQHLKIFIKKNNKAISEIHFLYIKHDNLCIN